MTDSMEARNVFTPVFLKERTISETDHWRHSTYEREDGSTFHVAIPVMRPRGEYHPMKYNEGSEAEMILRLR